MSMSDRDFLIWVHERLKWRGDSELMDFMHRPGQSSQTLRPGTTQRAAL